MAWLVAKLLDDRQVPRVRMDEQPRLPRRGIRSALGRGVRAAEAWLGARGMFPARVGSDRSARRTLLTWFGGTRSRIGGQERGRSVHSCGHQPDRARPFAWTSGRPAAATWCLAQACPPSSKPSSWDQVRQPCPARIGRSARRITPGTASPRAGAPGTRPITQAPFSQGCGRFPPPTDLCRDRGVRCRDSRRLIIGQQGAVDQDLYDHPSASLACGGRQVPL